MKNAKRIIALLLTAVMLFLTTAIAVNADENGKNVLVTVITDKSSYSATDTAKVTIKVENKSGRKLTGVVISADTDNWMLAKGSASNILDVGQMAKGTVKNLEFNAVVNRKADGIKFFFDGFLLFFKQLFNKPAEFNSYSAKGKSSTSVTTSLKHGGATVTVIATCWYDPVQEGPDENGRYDGWTDSTHFRFGSYPQTDVTSSMGAALDPLAADWKSYNYYTGSGTFSDGKMVPSDYMMYCDIKYNGNKYRGVKFISFRSYYTCYESTATTNKQEQQTNGYTCGNIYWFKYEPLNWRVLDSDTGLALCENIIDSQAYNNYVIKANEKSWGDASQTYYASNYSKSSLREWLTNDFYNTAFSETEQNCMLMYDCDNSCSWDTSYNSQDTSDKVFLLSYDEMINSEYGFNSSATNYDAERRKQGTDYAKCQGLWVINSPIEYIGNSFWWLRTPQNSSNSACSVGNEGYSGYNRLVYYTHFGVCPAVRINPQYLNDM